ncbi:hypothetical protein [Methylacidiphilum kamchatkense]|nr:hypothetical protein [Methylacidiphilum kamchatkense]
MKFSSYCLQLPRALGADGVGGENFLDFTKLLTKQPTRRWDLSVRL